MKKTRCCIFFVSLSWFIEIQNKFNSSNISYVLDKRISYNDHISLRAMFDNVIKKPIGIEVFFGQWNELIELQKWDRRWKVQIIMNKMKVFDPTRCFIYPLARIFMFMLRNLFFSWCNIFYIRLIQSVVHIWMILLFVFEQSYFW